MDRKVFVDVFSFVCPRCQRPNLQKKLFRSFTIAEVGQRIQATQLVCKFCNYKLPLGFPTNGEITEASPEEAASNPIEPDLGSA
jgi:hypothetical protein